MNEYLTEFLSGNSFRAYEYFGAHATVRRGIQGVIFRVYAPAAFAIELIGGFNGWQPHQMKPVGHGVFELFWGGAHDGQMYKYRVHAFGQDGFRDRADPFGRRAELRPGTASIIAGGGRYRFSDAKWFASRGNHYDQPMNIYEVHAGSWRQHPGGRWYTYREMAETLIPYCREHFYTHIEFLPLAEHPFDGSWGYQDSGYFAVTSRYGTPDDFCYLVDACHRAGIGVIMDFVPVHFIQDEYALARFDGSTLYEYGENTGLRLSEWGSCNFDLAKPAVRSFLQSAADFWLSVCHCDGLRFDAIRNMIYWQGREERGVREDGLAFLRGCNAGLRRRHPHALLIAEDSTSWIKVTAPTQYDGLGFDYKWDLGWMNDTLEFFGLSPAARRTAYHKLTFSMSYFYDNLFLLPLSHDEVVHGKGSILSKMWSGDERKKFAQCRALYLYFYTHPGKKLNFMGNEFAQMREWSEACEQDWYVLQYDLHAGFSRFLTGLAGLYYSSPALHKEEYDMRAFRWLVADDPERTVYAYIRQAGGDCLLTVLNLSDRTYPEYPLRFDRPVTLRELTNSDSSNYGGSGLTNDWVLYSEGAANEIRIRLAPFTGCIFRLS